MCGLLVGWLVYGFCTGILQGFGIECIDGGPCSYNSCKIVKLSSQLTLRMQFQSLSTEDYTVLF